MEKPTITFIGAGNMAGSIIGGLIADDYDKNKIWAADPDTEKLNQLQQNYKIQITQDNREGVRQADVLVFAVKPQVLKTVIESVADVIHQKKPLLISIAAMISLSQIQRWLKSALPIIRCMPNIAALLRCSATALYANEFASQDQKNLAESIMRAVGLTVWIHDEKQMDVVTALCGSGPANFFMTMEMLQQAAIKLGLPAETARLLTLQTALGAAKLAMESQEDVKNLREKVTSKGGVTEKIIELLEKKELSKIYLLAMEAACDHAAKLRESFNE